VTVTQVTNHDRDMIPVIVIVTKLCDTEKIIKDLRIDNII